MWNLDSGHHPVFPTDVAVIIVVKSPLVVVKSLFGHKGNLKGVFFKLIFNFARVEPAFLMRVLKKASFWKGPMILCVKCIMVFPRN